MKIVYAFLMVASVSLVNATNSTATSFQQDTKPCTIGEMKFEFIKINEGKVWVTKHSGVVKLLEGTNIDLEYNYNTQTLYVEYENTDGVWKHMVFAGIHGFETEEKK